MNLVNVSKELKNEFFREAARASALENLPLNFAYKKKGSLD